MLKMNFSTWRLKTYPFEIHCSFSKLGSMKFSTMKSSKCLKNRAQAVLGMASMYALLPIQIALCSIVNTLFAIPDLIYLELKDMELEYNVNHGNSSTRIRIRNIIMKVQDYTE